MFTLPSSLLNVFKRFPQYAYTAIIVGFLFGFLFSGGVEKLRMLKEYFSVVDQNASFTDSSEYLSLQEKIAEAQDDLSKQEEALKVIETDLADVHSDVQEVEDLLPRYLSVSSVQDWKEYTVQEGDTIESISEKFDISLSTLQEKNPEVVVVPGNLLFVPNEYSDWVQIRVKTSDTWKSLSDYYQVSVNTLQEVNNRENLVSDTILLVPNIEEAEQVSDSEDMEPSSEVDSE